MVGYQELITDISRRIHVDTEEARQAAEATIGTMAKTLDRPRRQRLLAAVPPSLTSEVAEAPGPAPDAESFVAEVSWLTGQPPEQARYRAQAVLAALADEDPDLVASLDLPADLQQMAEEPLPGGGIIGPGGHTPPLTEEEVNEALAELPDWSGDTRAIRRTLQLPRPELDQVLSRIDELRYEVGRAPDIERSGDTATLAIRTTSVDAVTALDIDLARRVDAIIAEGPPEVTTG